MSDEITNSIELYEKWEKVVIESSTKVNTTVETMNQKVKKSFDEIEISISSACNSVKDSISGLKVSIDQNLGKIDLSFSSNTSVALDKMGVSFEKLLLNLDKNVQKINKTLSSIADEVTSSSKAFDKSIDLMSIASFLGMKAINEGISFALRKLFENILEAHSIFTGLGVTVSSAFSIISGAVSSALSGMMAVVAQAGAAITAALGPIGMAILAITVAIAAVVVLFNLFKSSGEGAAEGTKKLTKEQEALNAALENSSDKLFNQKTALTQLAEEAIPKVKDAYNSISQELNEMDLNLNIGSSDELQTKFGELADVAKTSVTDMMNTRYTTMYEGFMKEDGLIDGNEQETLNNILKSGDEKAAAIDEVNQKVGAIIETARSENRGLNEAERDELRRHQQMLNDIALSGQQTEIDNKIALMHLYMGKKGELSKEELEKTQQMSEEIRDMEIEQLESKNAEVMSVHLSFEESYIAQRIANGKTKQEAQEEFDAETLRIAEAHEKEVESKMTDHLNRIMEAKTGHNMNDMAQYESYKNEHEKLLGEARDVYGEIVNQEAEDKAKSVREKMIAMGIEQSEYETFKGYMKKQPDEYKGIYQTIQDNFKISPTESKKQEQKNSLQTSTEYGYDGVVVGTNNSLGKVAEAAATAANTVMRVFSGTLVINSPSKKMIALSKWVPIGVAKGIEDNLNPVVNASKQIGDGIIDTFEDSNLDKALSTDMFNGSSVVVPNYQRANHALGDIPYHNQLIQQSNLMKELQEREQNITVDNVVKLHLDGEELAARMEQVSQRRQFRTGRRYL